MTELASSYREPQRPSELPAALPQPDLGEVRLEQVMSVLGEPIRLTILQKLLEYSDEWDHPCAWFGFDRPKSTLTHHYKVLREAGLITQRQYGLERRSRVRVDEIGDRFPGLIELLLEWTPPGDATPA